MFKMNPAAKEFVPAHILKKRQEEGARLEELAEQLGKVDVRDKESVTDGESSKDKSSPDTKKVQDSFPQEAESSNDETAKHELNNKNTNSPNKQKSNHSTEERPVNGQQHMNNNNHNDGDYPEELQDLIDEEDDRFLLNEGENLCEFNGEQFIIPGDDEFEPANRAGYDFGNAEDNEDEDVCNAFEEFLGNLPNQ